MTFTLLISLSVLTVGIVIFCLMCFRIVHTNVVKMVKTLLTRNGTSTDILCLSLMVTVVGLSVKKIPWSRASHDTLCYLYSNFRRAMVSSKGKLCEETIQTHMVTLSKTRETPTTQDLLVRIFSSR